MTSDAVLAIRRGALVSLKTATSGSLWVTAADVDSLTHFVFDGPMKRLASAHGTLFAGESVINWQRMVVDDDQWYLPVAANSGADSAAEGSFDVAHQRGTEGDWLQVAGTGFGSSPVHPWYWLLGCTAADPSELSEGQGARTWSTVVSMVEARDAAPPEDRDGVAAGFSQVGLAGDEISLEVRLDAHGRVTRASYTLPQDFSVVAELSGFSDLAQQPNRRTEIPLPTHPHKVALSDLFATLEKWDTAEQVDPYVKGVTTRP